MGYELQLVIGKTRHGQEEWKLTNVPYSDGSGFEPERDEDGNIVKTGRTEFYFSSMATLDLSNPGHTSEIMKLMDETHRRARIAKQAECYGFYGIGDGNTRLFEDRYGDPLYPVPIKTVLAALRKDAKNHEYRRFKWAVALLASMAKDTEELEVLLYGH